MNVSSFFLCIALIFLLGAGATGAEQGNGGGSPPPVTTQDIAESIGTGYYEFRSNVEGAEVFLDDRAVGSISGGILQVPVPVLITATSHELRIQAPGYSTYNETLVKNPKPGQTLIVRGSLRILPVNLTGSLSLAVSPPGCKILIDEKPAGTVDPSGIFMIRSISSGNHMIGASLSGYRDYSKQIWVDANLITNMRIDMELLTTGIIQVSSDPPGAQISINGTPYGTAPFTTPELEQGSYVVSASLPGYQPFQTQTILTPGQTTPVHALLQPIVTATPTPVPTTPEPTPTPTPAPTQAGLSGIIALVALCLGMIGILKKR
ncbi:MAG TPA: PEGA domain-containing protein [Methanospirillum sp.]|nr:PEGA domain-containing protein [Methanospirillum sp.]